MGSLFQSAFFFATVMWHRKFLISHLVFVIRNTEYSPNYYFCQNPFVQKSGGPRDYKMIDILGIKFVGILDMKRKRKGQ